MYQDFVKAIHNKNIVEIRFNSKEKGVILRRCIPFDFGPLKRCKDGLDRYHFCDLDSPSGRHTLSLLPNQILQINITNEIFEPGDYITWKANWFISRDWGRFS